MIIQSMKIKIGWFLSLAFAFSLKSSAQALVLKDSVRGSKYCEIVIVTGSLPKLIATVYSTFGCSECSTDQWKKIDANKLRKELDAKAVILNGPRYLLMDKIGRKDSLPAITSFDSLDMRETAVVIVNLAMAMKGKVKPYQEQAAHHASKYGFNKGSEVYELISPSHSYIMQSFSQMIDSTLTIGTLNQLGTKLKMPDGWQFKSRILDNDLLFETEEGKDAFVIQDELGNNYLRME